MSMRIQSAQTRARMRARKQHAWLVDAAATFSLVLRMQGPRHSARFLLLVCAEDPSHWLAELREVRHTRRERLHGRSCVLLTGCAYLRLELHTTSLRECFWAETQSARFSRTRTLACTQECTTPANSSPNVPLLALPAPPSLDPGPLPAPGGP